jgi:hypothetical protein
MYNCYQTLLLLNVSAIQVGNSINSYQPDKRHQTSRLALPPNEYLTKKMLYYICAVTTHFEFSATTHFKTNPGSHHPGVYGAGIVAGFVSI